MTNGRTAYLNARLLDPASGLDSNGALLVENGRITDLGPNLFSDGAPSVNKIIDCKGLCLAPGLIDMRVQLREPGDEYQESIASGSLAAAAGGVTTMVCLPNTSPVIDDVSVVEFIALRASEESLVKVFCYGALTRGLVGKELTEIGLLRDAGALAFTDGIFATADALVMRRALSYSRAFDALIVQHPEEPRLASNGVMNEGEIASRLGLAAIPAEAEVIIIERDIRLVELTGGRYHVAHVSTAAAIEVIRAAKDRGLNLTCDTAAHYFALNETAVGNYRTFAKVSPPLRAESDRQAVVQGLSDGTIDAIVSDHTPHDQEAKRLPFANAAFGVVGVETLLPLTLELYHNGHLSLLGALNHVTASPAKILRLKGGELARGAPADMVLFDPDTPWQISEDALHSISKNSAFDGRPVQGRVERTIVDGRTVFLEGD
jgi:dihydroorotase